MHMHDLQDLYSVLGQQPARHTTALEKCILTYTTTHKEQLNASALDNESSSLLLLLFSFVFAVWVFVLFCCL